MYSTLRIGVSFSNKLLMSKCYPYSHLHLGNSCTIATAGPHIKVLNSETGSILAFTADFEVADRQALLKSGPIRFSCVDSEFLHLATVGDDKKLKVWQIEGLKILSERELPKKPTKIHITRDGQTIVVSDKFGDVFSYPLRPSPADLEPLASKKSRDGIVSHENPSRGTLVLGHASLVTTFLLSLDEKFVITADRDEHIRVSWYPQGYNIEIYCLGHEKFVSALHIPASNPSTLISAGGDPVVKFWDWMTGSLLQEIRVGEAVEPFIVVKGRLKRWMEEDELGDLATVNKKPKGKRKSGLRQKGKNVDVKMETRNADSTEGTPDLEGDDDDEVPRRTADVEMLILAIHKVECLHSSRGIFVVFAAHGSTALFCTKYPSDSPTVSPDRIQNFNFRKPVLNFTLHDEFIWVLLDAGWEGPNEEKQQNTSLVRVVRWEAESEQFLEVDQDNPHRHLIEALNSQAPIRANPEDIQTLDVYAQLSLLPKNVDTARDPMKQDIQEQAELGFQMTPRELGRLRHKKALAAKLQKVNRDQSEDREVKKLKSESGASDDDVKMDDA